MTAHDPTFHCDTNRILRWLGFGTPGAAPAPDGGQPPADAAETLMPDDPRERRRRQLLTDVGSFLLTHRLEVNAYTLAIAHDVITGVDIRLARLIEERVAQRQPVTLQWLDEAGRRTGRDDGAAALKALMEKLDTSIEEFAQTATTARTVTHSYNSALEAHVDELEQVSKAGVVITELAGIARIMLDRTREIEKEMSRSELKTRALQKNLDEARRCADTDHLTGLPNRRAFEAAFEAEVKAAGANGEPLCVAFCDIDHFKRINDVHGHEAGDRVLKAVAQTLARISDDRCHVARHGGEEFVVLFRGKTIDQAFAALDATRAVMAERRLVNRATDVPFGRITFSAGIADLARFDSPREALAAADKALYDAKADGRNQVVCASLGEPGPPVTSAPLPA